MNLQTITAYALSVSPDTKFGVFSTEAILKAAEVTLLGMGMVFSVLSLLWLVLAAFKVIFAKEKKPKAKATAAEPVVEAVPAPVSEVATTDDGELIAVISAAIAAYRASEEGLEGEAVNGFRVVSFKRAGSGRAWNSNK